MKKKIIGLTMLVSLTLVLGGLMPQGEISYENNPILQRGFTDAADSPILIDSDESFATQALALGWAGSGNMTHPYIIESLSIDLLGTSGTCISISDTRVYFILRNNTLEGATYGLDLDNVTNGVVTENFMNDNYYGVYLSYSSNNTLANNTMSINDYSIYAVVSPTNTYHNNTVSDSMRLSSSGGNTITDNNFTNCGLDLYGPAVSYARQVLVSGNIVNGDPLIFWQDQTGGIVPTGAGQVIVVSSTEVTIVDQHIDSATNGISAIWSDFTVIANNTLTGNRRGIYTSQSSHIEVYGNNCTANLRWGMYLAEADYSDIHDNYCSENIGVGLGDVTLGVGIYVPYSYDPTVRDNTCVGNDYGIQFYSGTDWGQAMDNTLTDNTIGFSLFDAEHNTVSNNVIVGSTSYGIAATSFAANNLVFNNELIDNVRGIYFVGNNGNDAIGNNIKAPSLGSSYGIHLNRGGFHIVSENFIEATTYPIFLEDTESNTIDFNNMTSNNFGFYSLASNSSTISDNYIVESSLTGLYLSGDSHDNSVTGNFLVDSTTNVNDASVNANFDYNYYSDYAGVDANNDGIGDTAHPVPGTAGNTDSNPLFHLPGRPTWIDTPVDQFLLENESLSYDLDVSVNALSSTWSINNTIDFSIDSNGVVTNATTLVLGNYSLEVQVEDYYGFALVGTFTVRVGTDTTAPVWTTVPVSQVLDYGENLSYQLNATDAYGVFWSVNNTAEFSISETGLLTNNVTLSPGVYHLLVTVSDPHGNSISIEIDITVLEIATTSTTSTTTTSETTSTDTPTTGTTQPTSLLQDPVFLLLLGAGGIIFVVVVVIARKRS